MRARSNIEARGSRGRQRVCYVDGRFYFPHRTGASWKHRNDEVARAGYVWGVCRVMCGTVSGGYVQGPCAMLCSVLYLGAMCGATR